MLSAVEFAEYAPNVVLAENLQTLADVDARIAQDADGLAADIAAWLASEQPTPVSVSASLDGSDTLRRIDLDSRAVSRLFGLPEPSDATSLLIRPTLPFAVDVDGTLSGAVRDFGDAQSVWFYDGDREVRATLQGEPQAADGTMRTDTTFTEATVFLHAASFMDADRVARISAFRGSRDRVGHANTTAEGFNPGVYKLLYSYSGELDSLTDRELEEHYSARPGRIGSVADLQQSIGGQDFSSITVDQAIVLPTGADLRIAGRAIDGFVTEADVRAGLASAIVGDTRLATPGAVTAMIDAVVRQLKHHADLERVTAVIVEAGDLSAGRLDAKTASAEVAHLGHASARELDVVALGVGASRAEMAYAVRLEADAARVDRLSAGAAQLASLDAAAARMQRASVECLDAREITGDSAVVRALGALSATSRHLRVDDARLEHVVTRELDARTARADTLHTRDAQVQALRATELLAHSVRSDALHSDRLLADSVQAGALSARRVMAGDVDAGTARAESAVVERFRASTLAAEGADLGTARVRDLAATSVQARELASRRAHLHDARVESLEAERASVARLTAESLSADRAVVSEAVARRLRVTEAVIGDVVAERVNARETRTECAATIDLKATTANLQTLRARAADLAAATVECASIASARVQSLSAVSLRAGEAVLRGIDCGEVRSERAGFGRAHILALDAHRAVAQQADVGEVATRRLTASNADVGTLRARALASDRISGRNLHAVEAHLERARIDCATIERAETQALQAATAILQDLHVVRASANVLTAARAQLQGLVADVARVTRAHVDELRAVSISADTCTAGRVTAASADVERLHMHTAVAGELSAASLKAVTLVALDATVNGRVRAEGVAADRATFGGGVVVDADGLKVCAGLVDVRVPLKAAGVSAERLSAKAGTLESLTAACADVRDLRVREAHVHSLTARTACLDELAARGVRCDRVQTEGEVSSGTLHVRSGGRLSGVVDMRDAVLQMPYAGLTVPGQIDAHSARTRVLDSPDIRTRRIGIGRAR
jgi:hypothetical protein